MTNCIVYGCCNRRNPNKKDSDKSITFHTFPREQSRKRLWVRTLLQEGSCTEQSRICSAHFEEKYLDRTGIYVRLTKDAIPTIFPERPAQNPPSIDKSLDKMIKEQNGPFKGGLKVKFEFHKNKKEEKEKTTPVSKKELVSRRKTVPPKKDLVRFYQSEESSPEKSPETPRTMTDSIDSPAMSPLSTPKSVRTVNAVGMSSNIDTPSIPHATQAESPQQAATPHSPLNTTTTSVNTATSPVASQQVAEPSAAQIYVDPQTLECFFGQPEVAEPDISVTEVVVQNTVERATSMTPTRVKKITNEHTNKEKLKTKCRRRIQKLELKKRRNVKKITLINNAINKLVNQNLLLDYNIDRTFNDLLCGSKVG